MLSTLAVRKISSSDCIIIDYLLLFRYLTISQKKIEKDGDYQLGLGVTGKSGTICHDTYRKEVCRGWLRVG